MRPGLRTSNVNRTYFASVGPILAEINPLESSACLITCHCGLLGESFALDVAIVTVPFASALRNATLRIFSLWAGEIRIGVAPVLCEQSEAGSAESNGVTEEQSAGTSPSI